MLLKITLIIDCSKTSFSNPRQSPTESSTWLQIICVIFKSLLAHN